MVGGWVHLGLELEVPQHKLQEIEYNFPRVEERKTKMLSTWLELKQPTWAEVVGALMRIGERQVAQRIANKHGMFSIPYAHRSIFTGLYPTHYNVYFPPLQALHWYQLHLHPVHPALHMQHKSQR